MATVLHDARHAPSSITAPHRRRRLRSLELAAALGGLGLATLVGLDGSPSWQAVRVVGVGGATALLVAVLARGSTRWRGRLAALAGVPAIAVAVGFSPHWAKGGPVPVQLAAVALGFAGLGLAIGGTALATRGRRWWRRVGAGVAMTVAVVMVTLAVGQAVAATNVPHSGIAGDVAAEGLSAAHVAAGAPGRVQVWTVADAGHTDGLATEPDEWADRVTRFLSETLLPSSGKAPR